MSDAYFKLEGCDEWLKWLKRCQKTDLKKMNNRIARSFVVQGFNHAASGTQRRSGRLIQSMNMGATESYVKVQVTDTSFVVVYGTCVPYAAAVEQGFSQENRKGQFVPGYWSSGTFHYQPGAKTGMVLTGKVIPGQHMFEKSLDQLRDSGDMESIIKGEFRRLYSGLF